ncbi:MAG TPA: PAS domain-containing protein, partial [Beijerinckiaceae bacterium]|nr:PAS domain-containing protein [Beijerinckiaceae bacterium]
AGIVVGLVGTTPREARVDLEMVLLPLRHRSQPHVRVLGAIAPAAVPAWLGFDAVTRLETVSVRVLLASPVPPPPVTAVEVEVERPPVRRFTVYQGGRSALG